MTRLIGLETEGSEGNKDHPDQDDFSDLRDKCDLQRLFMDLIASFICWKYRFVFNVCEVV